MSASAGGLEARLRKIGDERYHHRHPFNLRMHDGTLTAEEIRTWARNRYYYQTRIPKKDSTILAKDGTSTEFRREWIGRIQDHDGAQPGEGGLALWLDLAEAVGCDRAEVESLRFVLPGVRDACDAYVAFVESHDLLESVASSLTEMFAGDIMKVRIAAFEEHYPWVRAEGLRYFQTRTTQAPRDAAFGLDWVLEHATSEEAADQCAAALERKCEILWSLLDAVAGAARIPALVPHAQVRFDAVEQRTMVVLRSERCPQRIRDGTARPVRRRAECRRPGPGDRAPPSRRGIRLSRRPRLPGPHGEGRRPGFESGTRG